MKAGSQRCAQLRGRARSGGCCSVVCVLRERKGGPTVGRNTGGTYRAVLVGEHERHAVWVVVGQDEHRERENLQSSRGGSSITREKKTDGYNHEKATPEGRLNEDRERENLQ